MAEQITQVLGIVGIKHCGAYDATIQYEKLNVVTYQGSSYCAKGNTLGNLPTDAAYWDLIAEKGDKGDTGSQGPKPVKGIDYYTASDIAELESTLSSDVSDEVSEQLSTLTSATPLVASSTAGMTDTTRIYVNITDGHWYWYDGANWQDGGVYQATQIGDESIVPESTNFLSLSENNIFNPLEQTINGVTIKRDYKTQVFSITGTTSATTRVAILKKHLPAGTHGLRAFDYSGTKPAIYAYTEEAYNTSDWYHPSATFGGSSYGANITIETAGTYYIVAYMPNNSTYNYQGKLSLTLNKTYQEVTSFVPVTYNIESFINQQDTTGINTLNKFTNIDYWKNKNCLLYGDSLTAWGTWGSYLSQQFGLNVTIKGSAGSTATYDAESGTASSTTNSGSYDGRLTGLPNNNDLIVVMFGTNDYLKFYELGTVPKTFSVNDTFDNTNFAGAMLKILQYLYTNNPNARIILMCPPWNHYQSLRGLTLRDYGDIIKGIGRLTTTPVVDLFANLNANALNYSEYYNDAGTHFNDAGYMRIASLLKEEIEALTPIYTE